MDPHLARKMSLDKTGNISGKIFISRFKMLLKIYEFNEAHQMFRSIYFRFMAQQKYDALMNILYQAVMLFLDYNQQRRAADLAILLVDAMKVSKCRPCPFWKTRLWHIFARIDNKVPALLIFLIHFMDWVSG